MRRTVKSLVLALALLFLWRLRGGAQACSCFPRHPQEVFCQTEVVIKATVVGKSEVSLKPGGGNPGIFDPSNFNVIKYDIQQTGAFKGPEKLFGSVFTATNSAACGVNLVNGTEYLLPGRLDDNGLLHVSLCSFVSRWEDLSATQKRGVMQRYQLGCDCKITFCSSTPCGTTQSECLWTDFLMGQLFRHFTCIKRSDGCCGWFTGGL
ncbi:metalloproteinase inhibitor 2-like [Syngnathoides biaculeatus]|uniref:metalloproteinase inhibitor 2-like n=1 Tax=Syngnathoides biaculeatus TaxID=300417 RepID=UPI002ADE9589|nr:metalloproteinase inhibitor 2-like [Syngnathoides biaculeatus]XP_061701097.1 metalloproteinase inhibitor 2-like [Syngnathoides biaculeatus]